MKIERSAVCVAVLLCFLGRTEATSLNQSESSSQFEDLSKRAAAALSTDPDEAAKLYTQAVDLRPSWAEGWFYLGASLFETKQYAQSRKAFQHATVLSQDNGTVWAFLGLCEYRMNLYSEALEDIKKGEALGLPEDPGFVSTIRNTAALISVHSSDFSAAVDQLRPLAKAADSSPATIEHLGVSVLGIGGNPSDAPAEQKASIELAGRTAWNLYAEHDNEATVLSKELTAKYPEQPGVHYLRGLCLLKGEPEQALAAFRSELRISPSYVPARLQIAILELRAGDFASALTYAEEAIKLEPKTALGHEIAGRAFLDLKQPAKALRELEAAVRLAPRNAQIHYYLERVYHDMGRTEDARKQQAEFVRLKGETSSPLLEMR